MPSPPVVDLSHDDNVTSFALAKQDGLLGVIHKATTGATGQDPAYKGRRPLATQAGLLWGAYHWGTAAPIQAQVDNFLDWATPDAHTLVALDYEPTEGNQMTLDGARRFLTLLGARLNRKPVIYSGALLKDELGATKDAFLGGHRLWLAQYGDHPVVQASWDRYWLWQFTDGISGQVHPPVPGIPGNAKKQLDCDRYDGTAAQLAADWAS